MAQDSSRTATPSDAKEFFRQATRVNGLTGAGLQPWHIRVSFKNIDQDGGPAGQGTYEEFWVSPTKFKRIFSGDGFDQTTYGTEKGPVQTGDSLQPPWSFETLRYEFVRPLPQEDRLDALEFAEYPAAPDARSRCIAMSGPLRVSMSASGVASSSGQGVLGVFCFDAEKPLLQIHKQGTSETGFHDPVLFEGRWLPRDLEVKEKGKVVLSAHLEVFETIEPVNEADFAAPADATRPPIILLGARHEPGQAPVSSGVPANMLVTKVDPVYPPIAHAARVEGTVAMQAVIAKDGHVKELRIVSGPPMLQQAALDAVKQWVFKPALQGGVPVEAMTTVNVQFQIPGLPAKK